MIALAAGADPFAVVGLAFLCVGGAFLAQERKATWLRNEKRAKLDHLQRSEGRPLLKRIQLRIEKKSRAEEPDLFGEPGDE
ncbi:hypothetical protein [Hansschlegelia sp.]|uniref:hypothetical protein n=1 Tax=Hansschlegelia sp. TaxID=2041892 RepID=UPI002B7FD45E|nr:hypothetical protein [Hansschlegelia sp.]HVI27497.1 hypothetical protein [Hansschlegelia sp.]